MADTFVFKGFLYDEDKILAKRNLEMGGAVQKFIDSEVLRLMRGAGIICRPTFRKHHGAGTTGSTA